MNMMTRSPLAVFLLLVACGISWPLASRGQDQPTDQTAPVSTSVPVEQIFAGDAPPKSVADLQAMQVHFEELAQRVKKATVGIECQGAQGSGVIVSRDGIVLTAAHVIGRPGLDAIITLPSGKKVKAKTKGLNHNYDSGMLQIVDPEDLSYLDIGESGELKQGQWVMAIGHPGGYQEARGLVIRAGRILNTTNRVLRTDCTLVGGDSGGPLVDMDGYVVGIHSRIGMRLSDNLHVPIDAFTEEWDSLEGDQELGGSQPKAWLGFQLMDGELKIESVTPNGPADKAGLQAGDKIVKVDGHPLNTREQLWVEVFQLQIGQEVIFTVERDGKTIDLTISVEGRRDR